MIIVSKADYPGELSVLVIHQGANSLQVVFNLTLELAAQAFLKILGLESWK